MAFVNVECFDCNALHGCVNPSVRRAACPDLNSIGELHFCCLYTDLRSRGRELRASTPRENARAKFAELPEDYYTSKLPVIHQGCAACSGYK